MTLLLMACSYLHSNTHIVLYSLELLKGLFPPRILAFCFLLLQKLVVLFPAYPFLGLILPPHFLLPWNRTATNHAVNTAEARLLHKVKCLQHCIRTGMSCVHQMPKLYLMPIPCARGTRTQQTFSTVDEYVLITASKRVTEYILGM